MSAPVPPRDGAPAALAWLIHPVTLAGLALLLINDHVLKVAFPGPATGKLSDVAGLVLAPPLVAALITLAAPRLPDRTAVAVGFGLVGAGFTAVKSHAYPAELASTAWTAVAGPSLVRADPTDLLTLPALLLSWWGWTRARRAPLRYRSARLVRLLVVLPTAMFAVAATSAVHHPYALAAAVVDGRPAVATGGGFGGNWPQEPSQGAWSVSDDGAAGWREPAEAERRQLHERRNEPRRMGCAPDVPARCYRVVAGRLRVEQSDDAGRTWRMAWEISDAQREPLARRYPDPGDVGKHFSSRQLAVAAGADGGHLVVVANGRDGYLVRRTDGRWERIGFPSSAGFAGPFRDGPPALGEVAPEQRQTDALLAAALALTLGFLVLVAAAHAALRRLGRGAGWGVAGLVAMLPAVLVLETGWSRTDDFGTVLAVFEAAALGALVAFVPLVVAWHRGAHDGWSGAVFGAFLLTVALVSVPAAGWVLGTPPRTWMTVLLAVVATMPGLLLVRRAARLVQPSDPRGPADPPYPALASHG